MCQVSLCILTHLLTLIFPFEGFQMSGTLWEGEEGVKEPNREVLRWTNFKRRRGRLAPTFITNMVSLQFEHSCLHCSRFWYLNRQPIYCQLTNSKLGYKVTFCQCVSGWSLVVMLSLNSLNIFSAALLVVGESFLVGCQRQFRLCDARAGGRGGICQNVL